MRVTPVALAIAGSDSGGGAGLQADLRTFAALGVYGYSAVTAVTAQNSTRIARVDPLPADLVAAQIESVAAECRPNAVKIGALINAEIVKAVAATIEKVLRPAPCVVDPVLVASSGARLLDSEGESALRTRLLPLATIVTPNIPEAEALSGIVIGGIDAMREAAIAIHRMGPPAVVIKGGHPFTGGKPAAVTATDILYDGYSFVTLEDELVAGASLHGGGCIFSSAIAAFLARGLKLEAAVREAKRVISEAIRGRIRLGNGGEVAGCITPR